MKSTRLIPLKSNTGSILVEIERTESDGIQPTGAESVIRAVDNTVDAAVAKIAELASSFANFALPKQVEKAVIEMGFQFDTKGTIYLVSSTATASIKVSLTLNFGK